jgi:hypothetical protein
VWRPPSPRTLWVRALARGPVILLAALLPSITFIDHWGDFAREAFASEVVVVEPEARAAPQTAVHRHRAHWGVHARHRHPTSVQPSAHFNVQARASARDVYLRVRHWVSYLSRVEAVSATSAAGDPGPADGDLSRHVAHCHVDAGSCSDQPMAVNFRVIPRVVELDAPHLTTIALNEIEERPSGVAIAVPTDPPRAA